MKATLNYTNRIQISTSLLAGKGNMLALRAEADIRKKVELTQKEMTEVGMTHEEDQLRWEAEKEKPLKVEFSALEVETLAKTLKALDEAEELTVSHMDLYDMFVTEETKK